MHYASYIDRDRLTFDLRQVNPDRSPADVFRVLLQYAEKVHDKDFEVVELAFQGKIKFLLAGPDFRKLGEEYDWQNPVYTMRTFPEKLTNPDGSRAFPTWRGGILGVMSKQMQELLEFHEKWWLSEMK